MAPSAYRVVVVETSIGKWITVRELAQTGKTKRFIVKSKEGDLPLGAIQWFGAWRKYAFYPAPQTVFETRCMRDIIEFIDSLMFKRTLEARAARRADRADAVAHGEF